MVFLLWVLNEEILYMQSGEKSSWLIMLNHKSIALYIFNKIPNHFMIIQNVRIPNPDFRCPKAWRMWGPRQALWLWNKIRWLPELQLDWAPRGQLNNSLSWSDFLWFKPHEVSAEMGPNRGFKVGEEEQMLMHPGDLWDWSHNQEPLNSRSYIKSIADKAATGESRLGSKSWCMLCVPVGNPQKFSSQGACLFSAGTGNTVTIKVNEALLFSWCENNHGFICNAFDHDN